MCAPQTAHDLRLCSLGMQLPGSCHVPLNALQHMFYVRGRSPPHNVSIRVHNHCLSLHYPISLRSPCRSTTLLLQDIPAKRGQGASADKLQVKADRLLPLVGLARSKQDPVSSGHSAQHLYRPPPAGASDATSLDNNL